MVLMISDSTSNTDIKKQKSKSKAIPVTGRGGLYGWDVKDPTLSRQAAQP
jgi:hypothetical protein